ncbi:MAG: hypothetical protein KY457_06235, partial [Actinobacteria bacterium]|nr:hypothetical protein [Actinomycetota bacterium]
MSVLPTISTVLGALILMAVLTDLIVTTIVPSGGAGPMTRKLGTTLWRGILVLHRRRGAHRALRAAGPFILVTIITLWLVGLIAGWALVFGQEGSVVDVQSGEPSASFGKVHFAAATILGRGATDFTPGSDFWRALEGIAAGTGVALVGLSIAYILPIVGAVVQKREVASYIGSLGGTPDEILVRAWDGESFGSLHLHFIALTPLINRLAQNHLAYPILHYFHSGERFTALGPSIVVLDETLTFAVEAMDESATLDPSSVRPCRAAVDGFLRTLTRVAIVSADEPVPPPAFDEYRDKDLPLRDREEIQRRYEDLKDRRCLLAGFLEHDGWTPEETRSWAPPGWADGGDDPRREGIDDRSDEERAQDDRATTEDTSAVGGS